MVLARDEISQFYISPGTRIPYKSFRPKNHVALVLSRMNLGSGARPRGGFRVRRNNGRKCIAGYVSHLEVLPSAPLSYRSTAGLGIPHSSCSAARNFSATGFDVARNFFPFAYLPRRTLSPFTPQESVILVWYRRDSHMALLRLLSFRCNKGREEVRRLEVHRCSGIRWCKPRCPLLPLATALLAPDRDKAVGITLFPQCLAPFYRTNPSYEGVHAHTLPIYNLPRYPWPFLSLLLMPCLWRNAAHAR